MLVRLLTEGHLGHGELWHLCNVFEPGDEFTDCDIARVEICGVIGAPKEGGEVVRRGSVGEENPVYDRIP
jgi:hypothetical protein